MEDEEEGGWVVGLVDDGIVVPPHFVVFDSAATAIAVHDNFVAVLAIDNVILVAVAAVVIDSKAAMLQHTLYCAHHPMMTIHYSSKSCLVAVALLDCSYSYYYYSPLMDTFHWMTTTTTRGKSFDHRPM